MATRHVIILFAFCLTASAQSRPIQTPGQIQTPGKIQQPKGTWQVPGKIQVPGEIQKVNEQCKMRLIVGADALFAFDKADLSPGAEKLLGELGPALQKESKHPISIEGHSDAIGSNSYNQDLSQKRARTVEQWLVSHGYLKAGAAHIEGYGKTRPIAPNTKPDGSDNPEGRQKNRRVEAVVDTCSK
jgi:outer membrane protein OmpA-like peptidoglycan-associated protein